MSEKMTEDELRTLTDEYDQYQLVDKLVAAYREQTTTLDRVRAAIKANGMTARQMRHAIRAALASQPEAPKPSGGAK